MFLQRRQTPLIGIDIRSNQVNLALVHQINHAYKLTAFAQADIPESKDGLVVAIAKAYAHLHTPITKAAVALPDTVVLSKIISVDKIPLSLDEFEEQIKMKAAQIISFPLHELYFDFQMMNETPDGKKLNVLLVATRSNTLSSLQEIVKQAGLDLTIVDVESHVIERFKTMTIDMSIANLSTVEPSHLFLCCGLSMRAYQ